MTKSWTWVGGDTAKRSAQSDLRVGVTTSRRELTNSTVIVTSSTGLLDAGSAGHPGTGSGSLIQTALLVDPCWDPDELAWIGGSLAASGISVTAGFSTHAHHDHLLWHSELPRVPRWASETASNEARKNRAELLTALGTDWSGELADEVGAIAGLLGPHLPWAGTDITMITHDAHAPGHTALWLPAARVLIAGDMLSEIELPLLEESSPSDYLQGLDALWPFVNAAKVIIPGHGTPAAGGQCVSRWAADRGYLDALISGADPIDQRRDLPGMAQAHRANLERAAGD